MPAMWLAGCGYVGETLPPALNRPMRVTDLAAFERGSKIVIQFTPPKVTTEDLPLKGNEEIELRIGPAPAEGFELATWARDADRVPVVRSDKTSPAYVEVSAAKYYGKTVVIAVNVHGPHGRTAGWSNMLAVPVVPALPTPEALEAADAPDAVHLEWHAAAPGFRVFRKLPEDQNWSQIGVSTTPGYTDNMIQYGKTYQYYVQAAEQAGDTYALSEISAVKSFQPVDKFAPAVPAGLSAVPGTRSIELVWERSTEKDFASYRVYRNGQKFAEGLTAPAHSDRDVQPGVKYQYQVSAVDTAGNESAKSPIAEAVIP
jgi:hypothetical protein